MSPDNNAKVLISSTLSADGILCLTLNDPARLNALSEAMLTALDAAFDAASANQNVRVIILAAAGPIFCAGHDLKEMTAGRQIADRGRAYFSKILHQCSSVMRKLSPVQNQ